MMTRKRIKIGKKSVEGYLIPLAGKNLIVVRGSCGYIMCGYLNMRVAEKFKDVAVKVTGVSTITDVLGTSVAACTSAARRLGIHKGQPIREVLAIIA